MAAATLWIDVEDLFEYALHNPRPSGIQRLAFELYRSLEAEYGSTGLIRFVRHNTARNTFRIVAWPEVAAVFDRLAAGKPPGTAGSHRARGNAGWRRSLRSMLHRLSPPLRASLIDAVRTQGRAFRAWWRVARATARSARSVTQLLVSAGKHAASDDDFAHRAAPGDVVLALGSPWSHPEYAGFVRTQCERNGLRFGLLLYDLSVVRYPEWFDSGLVTSFRRWLHDLLPLCDTVFAISRATAADVTAYAGEFRIPLAGPVVPLPLGHSLTRDVAIAGSRADRQPPAGDYVLFVSTIEVRKNHMLLFRVWRRLLAEMPRDQVPMLVFAGRVGWLVADLMQQIVNTEFLFGRLVLIDDATDAELAALYRGCLFTVYPSFFEGWGLPVTESLAFGKPCLVSDRTSLPEAGGNLARYLDPDDLHGWYGAIRQILEDRSPLAQWEARIRGEFKPASWSETLRALLVGLRHPLADDAANRTIPAQDDSAVVALAAPPNAQQLR